MLKIITTTLEIQKNIIEQHIDDYINVCDNISDIDSLLLLDQYTKSLNDTIFTAVILNDFDKVKEFVDKYKHEHLEKFICVGYGTYAKLKLFEYSII